MKYLTAWFYSEAGYSLSAPPAAMRKHPRLEVGDIFFHVVTHLEDPQMWLWMETASGRQIWKQIVKGETRREDNRRLTVVWDAKKNAKKPNWVTESWYKKMKDSAKVQGKGKAPGEYFCSPLPRVVDQSCALISSRSLKNDVLTYTINDRLRVGRCGPNIPIQMCVRVDRNEESRRI